MDQKDKDKLAEALSIPKANQNALDVGSDHTYTCKCQTCKEWWQLVGPEDPDKPYGPFSIEEIEDESELGQACRESREHMEDD